MPENPFRREASRTLKSGGGGGTISDMEARVSALEDKFDRIEVKLDRLAEDLGKLTNYVYRLADDMKKINEDVKEIKGKISLMPSTWQMVSFCIVLLGFAMSCGVAALAFAKYLHS